MYKIVSEEELEKLDARIDRVSSTHGEQERYHYQALKNPQYILERLPELLPELNPLPIEDTEIPTRSDRIDVEQDGMTEPTTSTDKEISNLKGAVKYLSNKVNEKPKRKRGRFTRFNW